MSKPLKKPHNRKLPTFKEKAFAKEFAKTLNGTQSALAVYDINREDENKALKTASVIGSENLAKPRVMALIEKHLEETDMDLHTVMKIHRRNMLQNKHLPTSQKAVETAYELHGVLGSKASGSGTQIAFIINK